MVSLNQPPPRRQTGEERVWECLRLNVPSNTCNTATILLEQQIRQHAGCFTKALHMNSMSSPIVTCSNDSNPNSRITPWVTKKLSVQVEEERSLDISRSCLRVMVKWRERWPGAVASAVVLARTEPSKRGGNWDRRQSSQFNDLHFNPHLLSCSGHWLKEWDHRYKPPKCVSSVGWPGSASEAREEEEFSHPGRSWSWAAA